MPRARLIGDLVRSKRIGSHAPTRERGPRILVGHERGHSVAKCSVDNDRAQRYTTLIRGAVLGP